MPNFSTGDVPESFRSDLNASQPVQGSIGKMDQKVDHNHIPIVIDGPNLVNRVLDLKIDHDLVAEQLSIAGVRRMVNHGIRQQTLTPATCDITIDFICSKKLFGPASNKFTAQEREAMLVRFMRETGVHVDEIDLPGDSEKGVDGAVQSRLEELAIHHEWIALVSADRDYVPVLRKLRRSGTRVLMASLQSDFPKELLNEAWGTVDLLPVWHGLFSYSYPNFSIHNFALADCRALVSNADDRQHNQVRLTNSGRVFMSTGEAVGNRETAGVRFCYETFAAGNECCGPRAASDALHVADLHGTILEAWRNPGDGYPIDS